jgi:hypothetical protein
VAYEQTNALRQLGINAATWTDVVGLAVLPISCNQVLVFNNSAVNIFLRTDPGNANSQATIAPGQQYAIGSPGGGGARSFLFPQGTGNPPCSLLSSSGSVTVTIEVLQ